MHVSDRIAHLPADAAPLFRPQANRLTAQRSMLVATIEPLEAELAKLELLVEGLSAGG